MSTGVGAGVDYVSSTSKEGDNLSGMLKKTWPRSFGWISDDIATLDTDSPDVKSSKNVTEGTGIGFFTDYSRGLVKLIGGAGDVSRAAKWVPENEKGAAFLKKNLPKAEETAEEAYIQRNGAKRRSDALDDWYV